jgi:hypothetical protein
MDAKHMSFGSDLVGCCETLDMIQAKNVYDLARQIWANRSLFCNTASFILIGHIFKPRRRLSSYHYISFLAGRLQNVVAKIRASLSRKSV